MSVEIYTSPTCGYCHQAKQYFKANNIPFIEHDVASDREAAQRMVKLTGQMGVPVIIIDGEIIIGFDLPRLQQLLANRKAESGVKFGAKVADASRYAHQEGAYIGGVTEGTVAAKAGLKAGDIIVGIDDNRIRTASDMAEIVQSLRSGGQVTVVFVRDERPMQARVAV
ncbi:MAG TPA: Uxx-star family glutaredoxin-like (seleno)protein [Dehalococcoidales bacterium]|nr:Uxx-star family glutaredoxin-like (seleno)protein [Dehalococcoidales bacterium]